MKGQCATSRPLRTRPTPHQDANNEQQGKLPELLLRHPSAHAEAKRAQHVSFSRSTDRAAQYTALGYGLRTPGIHDDTTISTMIPSHSPPFSLSLVYSRGFRRLHSLCHHNRVNAEHLRSYLLLSWTLKITCKKVMQCEYIWVYYY